MHWEHLLEAKWEKLRPLVQQQWDKLSEEDLVIIRGNGQNLIGRLEARYDLSSEHVHREVEQFFAQCEKTLEEQENSPCAEGVKG